MTQLASVSPELSLEVQRPNPAETLAIAPTDPWESWAVYAYNDVLYAGEGDYRMYVL